MFGMLKVDVEGAECESMMQWFESGSLANVRQIGIEFHEVWRNIRQYFTVVKELYKLGFVTIMWDENRDELYKKRSSGKTDSQEEKRSSGVCCLTSYVSKRTHP